MTQIIINPLTGQFLINDCGTGAGGFKPRNSCAKGSGPSKIQIAEQLYKTATEEFDKHYRKFVPVELDKILESAATKGDFSKTASELSAEMNLQAWKFDKRTKKLSRAKAQGRRKLSSAMNKYGSSIKKEN